MESLLNPDNWLFYVYDKNPSVTTIIFTPVDEDNRILSSTEEDMILSFLPDATHIAHGIFEIEKNEHIVEELVSYGFEVTYDANPEILFLLNSQTNIEDEDVKIDSLTDKGMDICSSCGKCVYLEDLNEYNECSSCNEDDIDANGTYYEIF